MTNRVTSSQKGNNLLCKYLCTFSAIMAQVSWVLAVRCDTYQNTCCNISIADLYVPRRLDGVLFFNRMAFAIQFLLFPLPSRHLPLGGAGGKRNTCCFVVLVPVCSVHMCWTILFKSILSSHHSSQNGCFPLHFFGMWHKSTQSCLEKRAACFYCWLLKSPHVLSLCLVNLNVDW